jgi:transcriptional regulator with XRE-family HTH domain
MGERMPREPKDHNQEPRVNLSGRHIRRLRRKRGWTLADVQAALEDYQIYLDRTSLGRIERGTQTITDREFGALRDLLDVSESELLWGTASTTSEERKRAVRSAKARYSRPPSNNKALEKEAKKRRNSLRRIDAEGQEQ